jgi:hypothetical protein
LLLPNVALPAPASVFFPDHLLLSYSSINMALTGQPLAASRQLLSLPGGTGLIFATATCPSSSNTSGHVSTHNPQPVHVFLSTLAVI